MYLTAHSDTHVSGQYSILKRRGLEYNARSRQTRSPSPEQQLYLLLAKTTIDIKKQIAYWEKGAQEDWEVARELLDRGRIRHGLYLAHWALEKMLKAHVCRHTRDLAPTTDNLVQPAELTALDLGREHLNGLAEINTFNIEAQDPQPLPPALTQAEARSCIGRAQETYEWLMNQL